MIAMEILANIRNDNEYKNWVDSIYDDVRDTESPLGSNINGEMSAQDYAAAYMSIKQRRPFVLEYYEKEGDAEPKSITMYINPEKLTMIKNKLISKQITRGGIFYHHYGDDHAQMSLSGTTGLSGMAGIKQIEEIYHASGTLLKYKNSTPVQIYGSVDSYNVIDYKDPLSVTNTVLSGKYSREMIDEIQDKMWKENKDSTNKTQVYNSLSILELYKENVDFEKFVNTGLSDSYSAVNEWDLKNDYIHYRQFYQKLIDMIRKDMPDLHESIIVNLAYELSLNKIYSNLQNDDKNTRIREIKKDALEKTVNFQVIREEALKEHIQKLKSMQQRDSKIRDFLRSGLINIKDEMKDPWLPRVITIYFENRAYVGHFTSFNYNRDAKFNYITYDLKFVITKQYEFNASDSSGGSGGSGGSGSDGSGSGNGVDTRPNGGGNGGGNGGSSESDSNVYKVESGDTLQSISKRFYGSVDYWSEIYAENISIIDDPNLIYPGMLLKIPKLQSGYRIWVVFKNDTLQGIARRFYGDQSKWRLIFNANPDITNPDLIYPKQILKIPI